MAECVKIAVVTQGETLDETVANLREAVALHLDGEDLAELGLAAEPALSLTDPSPPSDRGVSAGRACVGGRFGGAVEAG